MGTWSVVMSAVCGCTLLYVNMHNDQGYCVKSMNSLWLIVDYKTSLYTIHDDFGTSLNMVRLQRVGLTTPYKSKHNCKRLLGQFSGETSLANFSDEFS